MTHTLQFWIMKQACGIKSFMNTNCQLKLLYWNNSLWVVDLCIFCVLVITYLSRWRAWLAEFSKIPSPCLHWLFEKKNTSKTNYFFLKIQVGENIFPISAMWCAQNSTRAGEREIVRLSLSCALFSKNSVHNGWSLVNQKETNHLIMLIIHYFFSNEFKHKWWDPSETHGNSRYKDDGQAWTTKNRNIWKMRTCMKTDPTDVVFWYCRWRSLTLQMAFC